MRRIVLRSLFGGLLGDRADEVGERLEPALRYVQRSPLTRFDRDLRFNAYARARRGVHAADAVITAEVERRRAQGIDADEHPDVLSALLVGADDEKLTDAEVLDQVRSLIAAGYDTTSAAAAWVVHALGRNPEALDAVRAEVEAAVGDRPPTLDDLRQLPTVDGVVREVLRLWPPGFVAGRGSIADCEIAGHVVPGGSTVLYSAYVTGRDPEISARRRPLRPGPLGSRAARPAAVRLRALRRRRPPLHRLRARHPRAPGAGHPARAAGPLAARAVPSAADRHRQRRPEGRRAHHRSLMVGPLIVDRQAAGCFRRSATSSG